MHTHDSFPPEQLTGKQVDLHHSITAPSIAMAAAVFNTARNYLLRPDLWKKFTGAAAAGFAVYKEPPNHSPTVLAEGDYVSIDIPGPGNISGEGLDWTSVQTIRDAVLQDVPSSFGLTLVASSNPAKPGADTAHFFESNASSSFLLKQVDSTITLSYHGRNELPNRHTSNVIDNIRNTIVAAGAAAGLSELQWTALIKGLLEAAGSANH
ncbi:MAG: hypothetical protein EOO13_18330 [Chitinophagaceae bacterium]|nr:MAG: hypothetical protein EOO13_18330 [Chitinophagaceae bacterium]